MEKIIYTNTLYAIVVRGNEALEGMNFVTPDSFPLQLGVNIYEKGASCVPHVHLTCERHIIEAQEILHIDEGDLDLTLYDDKDKLFRTVRLVGGDTVFLVTGGHGIVFNEKTKIIEVKQGPYMGQAADKRRIAE